MKPSPGNEFPRNEGVTLVIYEPFVANRFRRLAIVNFSCGKVSRREKLVLHFGLIWDDIGRFIDPNVIEENCVSPCKTSCFLRFCKSLKSSGNSFGGRHPDSATSNDGKELRNDDQAVVPTMVPSDSKDASIPPDLAQVVAAWDKLPKAIKAGVLAMIHAAGGSDD
jgi:hypothetical protein